MRYVFGILTLGLVALSSSSNAQTPARPVQQAPAVASSTATPTSAGRALLDQYCVACHNQQVKTGGLALDKIDLARIGKDAEIWEKAVMKLQGGLMPPPGNRQPERAAVDSFVNLLVTSLDQVATASPNPGTVALHRLNRAEYANSIRELFGIDIDASALLPVDDIGDGFDNIANVLKVSPSFLEQYVGAAFFVSKQAVGDPPPSGPARLTLRTTGATDQPEGWAPLGTQPGTITEQFFPADGDYEFRAGASVLTIDGVRVPSTVRLALKAGYHKIGLNSVARGFTESDGVLQALGGGGARGGGGGGAAGGLQVTGPYSPIGTISDSPSRSRLFVCRPANQTDEVACATKILSTVARRAYRRPVTDSDLVSPITFFKDGRTRGDFEAGIKAGLLPILSSPKFLYRSEPAPANAKVGSTYKISDLELASRLSFFLWSQIPDDELFDLAMKKRLSDPVVLEQQVKRMLADPRSKTLVTNFAFQWLAVRELEKTDPDPILFPNFDQGLKTAFRREMEMFLDSIVRENRNVVDLLTADYTFVNERLASHYGIPDIRGTQFRRVSLKDENRWGLLGKGAILLVTSYPNRTSIVLRGNWILENIVGTPPAAPPPNVEGFKENKEGAKAQTVRAIMDQHRSNPSCNSCHAVIDPPGFALENFDSTGEWRVKDRWAGIAIDAGGKMVDGTPLGAPSDLRKALVKRPAQFVQTMTQKMMIYALGRSVEYYDMPTVRKIVRDAAKENYRFSSLVMGVVKSPAFQNQRVPEPDQAVAAAE